MPASIKIHDGYFEGLTWNGKDIFLNIHGPNHEGSFYSPGLVRYHYNGSDFIYVRTLTPPTYGSGRGIDSAGNSFYFVDRPANVIGKGTLVEAQKP
jgi:hypothetical protein